MIRRKRLQNLEPKDEKEWHYMMLHKTPADYGINSYQWTANFMQLVVKNKWQIEFSRSCRSRCFNGFCRFETEFK